MTTITRICSVAASLALLIAFPGLITLACLVVTGLAVVVDAIVAA